MQAGTALHLPHAHERRLSKSTKRPIAAAIPTTIMLHGVDEVGFSLGVDVFGLAWGAAGLGVFEASFFGWLLVAGTAWLFVTLNTWLALIASEAL